MKKSIRIVVSDDSRMARAGLIALLQSYRIQSERFSSFEVVGEASNGFELVALTEDLCPDLVFIDACMPVLNGIEATKIVKANHQEIKVIVMSMYSENRAPAFTAGADLFLEKGFGETSLGEVILKLVSEQF